MKVMWPSTRVGRRLYSIQGWQINLGFWLGHTCTNVSCKYTWLKSTKWNYELWTMSTLTNTGAVRQLVPWPGFYYLWSQNPRLISLECCYVCRGLVPAEDLCYTLVLGTTCARRGYMPAEVLCLQRTIVLFDACYQVPSTFITSDLYTGACH